MRVNRQDFKFFLIFILALNINLTNQDDTYDCFKISLSTNNNFVHYMSGSLSGTDYSGVVDVKLVNSCDYAVTMSNLIINYYNLRVNGGLIDRSNVSSYGTNFVGAYSHSILINAVTNIYHIASVTVNSNGSATPPGEVYKVQLSVVIYGCGTTNVTFDYAKIGPLSADNCGSNKEYNSTCVPSCPAGSLSTDSNVCLACVDPVAYIDMDNFVCTDNCSIGGADPVTKICAHCDPGDVAYNNACILAPCPGLYYYDVNYKCLQCVGINDKFVVENICSETCSANQIEDITNSRCIDCGTEVIENEVCVPSCTTGKVPNATTKRCEICATVIYNDVCISACPQMTYEDTGYCIDCAVTDNYVYNNVCLVSCDVKMISDDTNKTCIDCGTDVIENESCVNSCTSGKTPNATTKRCEICATVIYNNECISACPILTYEDTGYCLDCLITDNYVYNNVCAVSCDPVMIPDDTNKTCINCGTDVIEGEVCVTSCTTGKTPNASTKRCETCANVIYNNVCISACPQLTYDNSGYCIDCAVTDYYVYNNACLVSCDAQMIPDDTNKTCINCGTDVIENELCVTSCTSGKVPNVTTRRCEVCGNLIHNNDCVTTCPPLTYEDSGYCLDCAITDNYVYNNVCLVSCDLVMIPDDTNKTCIDCGSNVIENETCVSNCSAGLTLDFTTNRCNNCPINYYFYDGSCVINCPKLYIPDNIYKVCVSCSINDKYVYNNICFESCGDSQISDDTEAICIDCANYIYNNTCVIQCDNNQITNFSTMKCEDCSKVIQKINGNDQCVDSCSEGNIKEASGNRCVVNPDLSLNCENLNKLIEDTNCVDSCSYGAVIIENSNICSACSKYYQDDCKYSEEKPYSFEDSCVSSCPDNYSLNTNNECIATTDVLNENICTESYCLNRGTCYTDSSNNPKCNCSSNFIGEKCENNKNQESIEDEIQREIDKIVNDYDADNLKGLSEELEYLKELIEDLPGTISESEYDEVFQLALEILQKMKDGEIETSDVIYDLFDTTMLIAKNGNFTNGKEELKELFSNVSFNYLSDININDYIEENNSTIYYNGITIVVQVTDNSETAVQESLDNNIAIVDSHECIQSLIDKNLISEEDSVYTIINNYDSYILSSNSTAATDGVKAELVNGNGKVIYTSTCDSINIKISTPDNVNLTDYNSILDEYEADIFNSEDSFYNDKCMRYTINGSDVTITIRRETYDIEAKCASNCDYKGIDENDYIVCACADIELETYSDFEKKIWETFSSSNFVLFTCFAAVINSNLLVNVGFWAMNTLTIIAASILIWYYGCYRKKIIIDRDINEIIKNDACFKVNSGNDPLPVGNINLIIQDNMNTDNTQNDVDYNRIKANYNKRISRGETIDTYKQFLSNSINPLSSMNKQDNNRSSNISSNGVTYLHTNGSSSTNLGLTNQRNKLNKYYSSTSSTIKINNNSTTNTFNAYCNDIKTNTLKGTEAYSEKEIFNLKNSIPIRKISKMLSKAEVSEINHNFKVNNNINEISNEESASISNQVNSIKDSPQFTHFNVINNSNNDIIDDSFDLKYNKQNDEDQAIKNNNAININSLMNSDKNCAKVNNNVDNKTDNIIINDDNKEDALQIKIWNYDDKKTLNDDIKNTNNEEIDVKIDNDINYSNESNFNDNFNIKQVRCTLSNNSLKFKSLEDEIDTNKNKMILNKLNRFNKSNKLVIPKIKLNKKLSSSDSTNKSGDSLGNEYNIAKNERNISTKDTPSPITIDDNSFSPGKRFNYNFGSSYHISLKTVSSNIISKSTHRSYEIENNDINIIKNDVEIDNENKDYDLILPRLVGNNRKRLVETIKNSSTNLRKLNSKTSSFKLNTINKKKSYEQNDDAHYFPNNEVEADNQLNVRPNVDNNLLNHKSNIYMSGNSLRDLHKKSVKTNIKLSNTQLSNFDTKYSTLNASGVDVNLLRNKETKDTFKNEQYAPANSYNNFIDALDKKSHNINIVNYSKVINISNNDKNPQNKTRKNSATSNISSNIYSDNNHERINANKRISINNSKSINDIKTAKINENNANANVNNNKNNSNKDILNILNLKEYDEIKTHHGIYSQIKSMKDYKLLPIKKQLELDIRSSCMFVKQDLKHHHTVLNLFYYKSTIAPFLVRFMSLMLNISVVFAMNAMFYTDGYLDDLAKVKNEEKVIALIYYLYNDLLKSVYSSLVTIVICILVKLIVIVPVKYEIQFNKALITEDKLTIYKGIKTFYKQMRCRYIIWFICVFTTHILCWWLVIAFCAVYINTNTGWLFGALISVFLDWFIIQITLTLIYTILRYFAKRNSKCITWLYRKYSKLMDTIR